MLQPGQISRPIWQLNRMTASFLAVVERNCFTADVFFVFFETFSVPASPVQAWYRDWTAASVEIPQCLSGELPCCFHTGSGCCTAMANVHSMQPVSLPIRA